MILRIAVLSASWAKAVIWNKPKKKHKAILVFMLNGSAELIQVGCLTL